MYIVVEPPWDDDNDNYNDDNDDESDYNEISSNDDWLDESDSNESDIMMRVVVMKINNNNC
jgi:hypothetical protein